jgi:hypothetical protein
MFQPIQLLTAVTRVEKSSFAAATPTMFGFQRPLLCPSLQQLSQPFLLSFFFLSTRAVITPNTSALIVLLISYVIILDLN